MNARAFLKITFSGYWRSGSGGSGAGDVDAAAGRDRDGLPYVPGRQLKGLVREAGERLVTASFNGWDRKRVGLLFGEPFSSETPIRMSVPGVLDFRNGRLPSIVREAVRADSSLASLLFTRVSSTAIDPLTGAAKSGTLRSLEVAVPQTLFALVRWAPDARLMVETASINEIEQLQKSWVECLDDAAALVLAIGADRSDGYGRAIVEVVREAE
ncbi:MAG: RAMP superfamily CRISPR-associated protein [Vicinamibacterales bacterium]